MVYALKGIPLPQVARLSIRDLLEVCHGFRSDVDGRKELLPDLAEPLCDESVRQMWTKLPDQRVESARVVRDAKLDVPRILRLQPIVEGHALHHQEGHDTGDPHFGRIQPAFGKGTLDLDPGVQLEGQIAPPRLPRGHILHGLGSMAPTGSTVFPGQEVHFHRNGTAGNHDLAEEDEGLSPRNVPVPEEMLADRLVTGLGDPPMV